MSTNSNSFADAGVEPRLLSVLDQKQITTPTPIQEQSIPVVLTGDDVLGVAKTGTGKTLSFVLPLLQMIAGTRDMGAIVIVLPTRELAYQVQETVQWFERALKLRSVVIVGGESANKQIRALKERKPQVVIGTPGRINDLLDQGKLHFDFTKHLVLDEADRMFDMGFEPQIKKMLQYAPAAGERQTLLFSATMPDSIVRLIQDYMREPTHIEVASHGSTSDHVKQEFVVVDSAHKKQALLELLERDDEAAIIFTRTKYQAKKLNRWLRDKGFRSEELHGNRSLPQRKRAVAALQSKKSRILVATDIAARGIDISHIGLVINHDLPDNPDDYVHRIGRTGRAGRSGYAISFVATDQAAELRSIQKLISASLNETELDSVPTAELKPAQYGSRRSGRGRGRGGRSRGRGRSGGGRSGGGRGRSGGGRSRRGGSGGNRSRNRSNSGSGRSQKQSSRPRGN